MKVNANPNGETFKEEDKRNETKIASMALAILLMGCFEGATGPAGKDGASSSYYYSGILAASSALGTPPNQYWDISTPGYFGACMVQAEARVNSGQMWQPPTTYLADFGSVRIIGSEWLGDEYRIWVMCGDRVN